jgi:hypothetical protein
MNRILSRAAAALALVCAGFAAVALADVITPENERPRSYWQNALPMTIETSDQAPEAELWIPADGLHADAGPSPAGTAASGAALSLAFVTGGLWLARRRVGSKGAGIAAGVLCVTMGATVYTYANAGPPDRILPQDPGTLVKAVTGDAQLSGHVRVYLDPNARSVRLVIPTKQRTTK